MAATKNNSNMMYAGIIVVIVIVIGVLYFVSTPAPTASISSTIPYTNYSTTSYNTSSTTVSQSLGGCPNINYRINNTVTGTTEFEIYTVSGTTDYVLSPGGKGSINYTTIITPLAGQTPNILNRSELVSWANNVQYPISGGKLGNATNSTVSGMSISFAISQQNLTQNTTEYKVTATVLASANAQKGTYYITLGPGLPLCGAELALITIGSAPYNGTLPAPTAA